MKNVIQIKRKNYMTDVILVRVGDLDKSKCSTKFLAHNFHDDVIVYVKCLKNGEFVFRGKKQEYSIIIPDEYEDFSKEKEEIINQLNNLISRVEKFSYNVSPRNWRSLGGCFSDLKNARETFSNLKEATPKEKKYIKEYYNNNY